MSWQEPAVAVVVLLAVVFLVRKLFGRVRPSKKPDVPLSRLRRPKPGDRD
jgi:hypothetical protein